MFFQNTVYYRFHNQFSLDLHRPPVAPPDMHCPRGKRGWSRRMGVVVVVFIFPALQIRATQLLCEPPQVAMIFLKDLSMCRSKLIS